MRGVCTPVLSESHRTPTDPLLFVWQDPVENVVGMYEAFWGHQMVPADLYQVCRPLARVQPDCCKP